MNGNWIQTYTGRQVFFDAQPNQYHIVDIAHGLSNACRFAGQCNQFYSVAQHSVLVSQRVPEEFALWGLMHDAPEAYTGDIVHPYKIQFFELQRVEAIMMRSIGDVFGLSSPRPDIIGEVDVRMWATEWKELMLPSVGKMGKKYQNVEPYPEKIAPVSSIKAEQMFLNMWLSLIDKKHPQHKDAENRLLSIR